LFVSNRRKEVWGRRIVGLSVMGGEELHGGGKTCLSFRVAHEMGLTIGLTITCDGRRGME